MFLTQRQQRLIAMAQLTPNDGAISSLRYYVANLPQMAVTCASTMQFMSTGGIARGREFISGTAGEGFG